MSERLAKGVLSLSKLKWEEGADGRRRRKPGSSDAAPDYFGTLTAEVGRACGGDAIKLRLAGWARKSQKTGRPYMELSLEFDSKELRRLALEGEAPAPAAPAAYDGTVRPDDTCDEELPF